ncbi:unnamed protein product [Cladocopium goreaui]|uniref:Exostosin-1c n=1 Tax=Cladocopium goreaui TaxID=2562237 RepID=A0A9P1FFT7_9DINO|nr:unnamed protein product [Cladocopium goreaui]
MVSKWKSIGICCICYSAWWHFHLLCREGRFGPLGDQKFCRDTRKARLETYVRNGWAPFWGVAGKQHIVFDQLCYHPLMELVNANHFVTLAGVGYLKSRVYGYRPQIDISWPEMPVTMDAANGGCDCSARPRLVSFQGAGTRKVRHTLQELHDGEEIVVHVVDVSKSSLNTTDARWNLSHPIKQPYANLMWESDFALAPAGHTQCSLRLYEIMSFCTIPVILADEKFLPFNEILNWSEMAVLVPEKEALSIPMRLRSIDPATRCAMRRKAHEAFHRYFANVTANIRGLLDVLQMYWQEGFGPNEESRRLEQEFQQHSRLLSWSPLAQEDFQRRISSLAHLRHGAHLDQDKDCKVSLNEVLTFASADHQAGAESLACWAMSAVGTGGHRDGIIARIGKRRIEGDGRTGHLNGVNPRLSMAARAKKSSTISSNRKMFLGLVATVAGNGLSLKEGQAWHEDLELLELLVTSAFHHLDSDWDQQLNRREFESVEACEDALDFSTLDFNNDSHIALRELLWQPLLSWEIRQLALQQGFALADEDQDGQLSGPEMERPSGQQLLHLLSDAATTSSSFQSAGCVARTWRREEPWAQELRRCGFVHLLPGLFPEAFVTETLTLAKRSNCSVQPLNAEGISLDHGDLRQALQEVMSPKECCEVLALQFECLPQFDVDAPAWRGSNSPGREVERYTVLLVLEPVTVPLLAFAAHSERSWDHPGCADGAVRSQDGYVARRLWQCWGG